MPALARDAQHPHPTTRPAAAFRCPACRAWTAVGTSPVATCRTCGQRVPVPPRIAPDAGRSAGPPPAEVQAACPHCHRALRIRPDVDASLTCPHCRRQIGRPGWLRWWRPTARYLTPAELRYSLHHLMLSADYAWWPDAAIPEQARTRFEFYCGNCGELHTARVWDIGSQRYCGHCGVLLIVPTRHGVRTTTAPTPPAAHPRGTPRLYCPQCGQPVAAEAGQLGSLHCPRCGVRF